MSTIQSPVRSVISSVISSVLGGAPTVQLTSLVRAGQMRYNIPAYFPPANDWSISFNIVLNDSNASLGIFGGSSGDNFIRLEISSSSLTFRAKVGTGALEPDVIISRPTAAKLNRVVMGVDINDLAFINIDGGTPSTQTWALDGNQDITRMGVSDNNSSTFGDIFANVVYRESGIIVRNYPIDETFQFDNVLHDRSGNGQDGTAINITAAESQPYAIQPNGDLLALANLWSFGDSVSTGAEGIGATVNAGGNVLVIDQRFQTRFTASGFTSGGMRFKYGTTDGTEITANGTFTETELADAAGHSTVVGGSQCNAGATFSPIETNRLVQVEPQPTISFQVQAVFDRMSALDQTEMDAIETLVDGLVADGTYSDITEIYAPCLNATDFKTGFKFMSLLPSASAPVHTTGEFVEFSTNAMHYLDSADFDTFANIEGFIGVYNVFTGADTTGNSDLFGVADAGGNECYLRWRGNDTNDFNTIYCVTSATPRTAANVRPTGDLVGMGLDGVEVFNLAPGGYYHQGHKNPGRHTDYPSFPMARSEFKRYTSSG